MRSRTSKSEIRFRFWNLGIEIQNLSPNYLIKSNVPARRLDLSPKFKNLPLKTWNSITIFNFRAQNSILKICKSFSSIPFEFRFGIWKFEISVVENPQIYILASKFRFSLQIFLRPKSWFCIRLRQPCSNHRQTRIGPCLRGGYHHQIYRSLPRNQWRYR